MVSNFLQSMAQKQAKEIDKEFGANAHGGSEWLQQNTQTAISPFLFTQAKKELDNLSSDVGYVPETEKITLADLKAQREQAQQSYNRADNTYKTLKSGFGAASMQSKGGWVGNYLNQKATGKDAKQFDWQTFSTAIEDKNRAEKEIAALDAAISQFELDDYITQNYGSMDNDAALAMSEAELQKARDEYYRLKRGSTIGAKSNKFTTIDQREQLAAAEEKYQRAKDVNTYFKDAVWWENADIDREKLEKTAQLDPSYTEKVSDATKAFAQLSGGIFDTQMTAKEMATLAVLQSTDADAAKRYQEIIDYDINKRRYQAHKENLTEAGGFANLLAYYGSTAAAPLATLDNAWRGLKEWITGEYKPVDYYSEAYIGPQTREISSSNLLDNIESPGLQMLAELGLSAGQFVLAALTSKGIGSAFGANAGKAASFAYYNTDITANSMYSALKSGASRAEAAAIGIGDGLAEAAAEMLPLNRLLKVYDQYKAAGKFFSRETIKQILAQGGIEGSEELVTSYLSTLNNMLIMGERSDFNKAISEYMQYGLSAEEAYDAAITDFFITEPLVNSFFGGAIGGGVFGAGATMIGSLRGGRGGTNENRQGHIPLTDEDLAEYLQTGKRQSTRNKKNRMVEEGQSPILTTAQSITSFIKDAISGKTKHVTKAYGKVGADLAAAVAEKSGGKLDISGKYLELSADELKHSYDEHSKAKREGDIELTEADFEKIVDYIDNFDDIIYVQNQGKYGIRIQLAKKINGYTIITELLSQDRQSLRPFRIWGISTEKYNSQYKNRGTVSERQLENQSAPSSYRSTSDPNITQGRGEINSEQGQGGSRDRNTAEDIADDALVLPTVNTPAMSGAEYKQRQEEQNRAATMTSAAEAAGGQPQPITQADRERANQLMEREMAAEQAEEEALSPDNFLTGELAERAAGGIIGSTTDSADTGYDIGEEIGDVGFGEGAIDNLPEQDLAERFRNKQQSGQTVTAPNDSAKLKMLRNQLRNKGIRDVRVEDLPDGERGYYDPVTNEIVVSSKLTDEEAFNFAMGHAVVHHAVRADEDLVDDVISSMRADGIDVDARIAAVIARYRRHAAARGEDPSRIDERYAMEEVVADYIGEICRNDRYLQQLASDQPNLLVRIIRMLEDLLANLGHSREEINKAREYEATISRVQDALAKAGHEEMIEGERRYSIDENYEQDIDDWNKRGQPDGEIFVLGSTGEVLQGLGAMEQDIFLRSEKINNILQKHPEISLTEIKRIPEILDDLILIIKSRNARRGGRQNTRLVLFGSVRARNGQPVLVVLDLRPVENGLAINDMQKVNSAYARKNVMNYLNGSYVLHADKNRTIPLLRNIEKQKNQIGSSSNRLARTGPEELLRYGSMGSITYENGTVKLEGIPFNEVIRIRSDNDSIQNETENNRRYSLEEENDPDLQRAIEMQQEGYSPTDISNATGKVVMANGDIYSGIGGVLQYSPNREQGGDIGGRREQEAGRAGTYQGRADNQDEAGQGLGEVARTTRNDDRRRNRADGGRVREEARGWEELSENERQGFAQIAKQYLQAEPGSELEMMLNAYGASDNDTYIDIAEEIYNDLAIHPALVEDRWVHFVPDVQALISDFETAMENTGRRYSLEEDSEGDGLSGALTEEETTTANAMANGMPFEEALKATEDQTLIFILTLIAY